MKNVLLEEIEVTHGANTRKMQLPPGTTVMAIRVNLTEMLGNSGSITNATALADGKPVSNETQVPPGTSTVEFLQPAGKLG